MKNTKWIVLIVTSIIVLLLSNASLVIAFESASEVADKVDIDIARTVFQSEGKNIGRAVLVLDELHSSRMAQLQEALILEGLYYDYGVRKIVLEGYLVEDKQLDTDWFSQASDGNIIRRAKVAAQLLREGEINAGEYWKLVHPKVEVIAAETKAEHAHEAGNKAYSAPEIYLLKIAEQYAKKTLQQDPEKLSIVNQLVTKLNSAIKELNDMDENVIKSVAEQKQKVAEEAYHEYLKYMIDLSPWCKQIWADHKKFGLNSKNPSLKNSLRIANALKDKAVSINLSLVAEEEDAMLNYIAFLQARNEGTLKIANTLKTLCKESGPPIVVIIGIGHSIDLADELDITDCSYAIMRPTAVAENRKDSNDIPYEMYKRKYQRLSIYSKDLLSNTLKTLPISLPMKPPIVINEPWAVGKIECYTFIDRILDRIFKQEPPMIPPNWGGGGFHGKFVSIDPNKIQIINNVNDVLIISDKTLNKMKQEGVSLQILTKLEKLRNHKYLTKEYLLRQVEILIGPDDLNEVQESLLKNVEKDSYPSILIPIVFNQGKSSETTIWAKATRGQSQVSSDERQEIENILKDALKAINTNKTLTKSMLDTFGRVQIGLDTVVAFRRTSNVKEVSLSIR